MAVDFAKPAHHDDVHWDDEDDIFCPHDHLESGGGPNCPHCVDDEKARQRCETESVVGPGRTLDAIFTLAGEKICDLVAEAKKAFHRDVSGVVHAIRELRRHEKLTIVDLYFKSPPPSESESKRLEKYCERLVKYARSSSPQRRLAACSLIVHFAVLDPVVRATLLNIVHEQKKDRLHKLDELVLAGKEPIDVALLYDNSDRPSFAMAWRAVVALERREIHNLWKTFHSHLTTGEWEPKSMKWYSDDFLPNVSKHMKDPHTSFLVIRHWYYLLEHFRDIHGRQKIRRNETEGFEHKENTIDTGTGFQVESRLDQAFAKIDEIKECMHEAYKSAHHKVETHLLTRGLHMHRRMSKDFIQGVDGSS